MESGICIEEETPVVDDIEQFGDNSTEDAVFDASQYAFFGNNLVEEVELGGFAEEEEDLPAVESEEEVFLLGREEGQVFRSLSGIDDLAGTFLKLNEVVSGPRNAGITGDGESREHFSPSVWTPGEDFPNWLDQEQLRDPDGTCDGKKWFSQPYSSPACTLELNPLHRTSYSEQQLHHQHFSSEPIPLPKSSHLSYPSPGGSGLQASPNKSHLNIPFLGGGSQMARLSPNLPPFSSQFQVTGMLHGSPHFGVSAGLSANSKPSNQWVNCMQLYPGDDPNSSNDLLQQQLPQNGLMPPQLISRQQHRLHRSGSPSPGHVPSMHSQLFNPHPSVSPPLMNSFEPVLGLGGTRDPRPKGAHKGRENLQYFQHGFDMNPQKIDGAWHRFRSKYMTAYEIEGIQRIHLAAIHSSDPYVEDYCHQACLAKKTAGTKLKHHFCPTHLRDLPPQARANAEPHAFLQVDALGRVPFSSIRRPRPLLEVDSANLPNSDVTDQNVSKKPLEQEPMLAARVAIEDGLCLLLDVDDIDRFLEFNQPQDGGAQLRCRRQVLLESLATSLQLVDPIGENGHTVELAPKDDLVFLRLVSLPKGQKLLARYLQLLSPGSNIVRVVCMAIFRHLRFLFGDMPSDLGAVETTNILARVVSLCVHHMDIVPLSACLATVVFSSELPSLRPLGSFAGNGASLILLSVFERATELSSEHLYASEHNVSKQAIWQASFDEFFGLLIRYCINKYDSIMHSSLPDPAEAIKKELPVDLLRASVPHTNDFQKKMLYNLSQRSLVGQDGVNGSCASTASVLN